MVACSHVAMEICAGISQFVALNARRGVMAGHLAMMACLMSCTSAAEQSDLLGQVETTTSLADPTKLLTARPGAAILQARISAVLGVQNGCLVVGAAEPRTVMWPAGTILAPDRRAVIVPGARHPIVIGDRILASGGTITLESPPVGAHATALSNGCPGTLVVISELIVEE